MKDKVMGLINYIYRRPLDSSPSITIRDYFSAKVNTPLLSIHLLQEDLLSSEDVVVMHALALVHCLHLLDIQFYHHGTQKRPSLLVTLGHKQANTISEITAKKIVAWEQ